MFLLQLPIWLYVNIGTITFAIAAASLHLLVQRRASLGRRLSERNARAATRYDSPRASHDGGNEYAQQQSRKSGKGSRVHDLYSGQYGTASCQYRPRSTHQRG